MLQQAFASESSYCFSKNACIYVLWSVLDLTSSDVSRKRRKRSSRMCFVRDCKVRLSRFSLNTHMHIVCKYSHVHVEFTHTANYTYKAWIMSVVGVCFKPFTATVFSTQPLHTNFQKFQIHVMDKLFALWHSAMYI